MCMIWKAQFPLSPASTESCFSQELAGPSYNCSCMIVALTKVGAWAGTENRKIGSKRKKKPQTKNQCPDQDQGAGKGRVPNFSAEGVEMHCTGGYQVTSQADHWTGLWKTGRICSWFSCMVLTCPSAIVSHFPIVSLCQSCWLFLCEVLWDVPKWSTKYKLSVSEYYVFQGSWLRTGGREKAGRWLGGANKEAAEGRKERRGTGEKKKKDTWESKSKSKLRVSSNQQQYVYLESYYMYCLLMEWKEGGSMKISLSDCSGVSDM